MNSSVILFVSSYHAQQKSESQMKTLYIVSQKRCHQTHGGNFVKSQPIFKIFSPLEREGNLQYNPYIISHRTLSYVAALALEISNLL